MVLFGSFKYSDRGILDWSHLRFFTARSMQQLLKSHGYKITGRHYTIVPLERIIPMRSDSPFMRTASRVVRVLTRLAPGLAAYEIVMVAEI